MRFHSISKGLIVMTVTALTTVAMAAGGGGGEIQYADPTQHFHPKGKPPSEHTLAVLNAARESMPFNDTRDFDEARKGFIAPLDSMVIKAVLMVG